MTIEVASFSDPGPRKNNEDATLASLAPDGGWLLAVADGLGGHFGGAEASRLAVETLSRENPSDQKTFRSTFLDIHYAIIARQAEDPQLRGMATTLTAVKINGNRLIGAHCGDTRCVVQRGTGIKKITVEHTEAQRFFELGKLSKTDFITYPRRNILESALGASDALRVDDVDFDLAPGDKVLITSDGVHEKVRAREVLSILLKCRSAQEAVNSIVESTMERVPEDNLSVICAYVR